MKLWHTIGKIAFWITWPLSYIYLRFSRRTRVFIRCENELLVVKGWLGSGAWSFPGGGLHLGEEPSIGAAREVQEEVGIRLEPNELIYLFEKKIKTAQGFTYTCIAFAIDLPKKPELKKPSGELTVIDWQPIDELCEQKDADLLLKPALATWGKLGKI